MRVLMSGQALVVRLRFDGPGTAVTAKPLLLQEDYTQRKFNTSLGWNEADRPFERIEEDRPGECTRTDLRSCC